MLNRDLEILEYSRRSSRRCTPSWEDAARLLLAQAAQADPEGAGRNRRAHRRIEELRPEIEEANLPEEARKEADRELDPPRQMPPQAAEYVSRTYIDWLVALPWNISTEDNLDIRAVRECSMPSHYGLDR